MFKLSFPPDTSASCSDDATRNRRYFVDRSFARKSGRHTVVFVICLCENVRCVLPNLVVPAVTISPQRLCSFSILLVRRSALPSPLELFESKAHQTLGGVLSKFGFEGTSGLVHLSRSFFLFREAMRCASSPPCFPLERVSTCVFSQSVRGDDTTETTTVRARGRRRSKGAWKTGTDPQVASRRLAVRSVICLSCYVWCCVPCERRFLVPCVVSLLSRCRSVALTV